MKITIETVVFTHHIGVGFDWRASMSCLKGIIDFLIDIGQLYTSRTRESQSHWLFAPTENRNMEEVKKGL